MEIDLGKEISKRTICAGIKEFYSKEDLKIIGKAFDARNTSQYYVDKIVSKGDIDLIISNAPYFLRKSKEILSRINEKDIKKIREEIEKLVK